MANLAIPLVGVVLGLAFAALTAVLVLMVGLTNGDLTSGHFNIAMLPLYYGALGLVWAVPSFPGIILALPFVVVGEIKGIQKVAYYGTVGGVAAAVYEIAAYYLGYSHVILESSGIVVMTALFGVIAGVIYWRLVGRNAGGHTAAKA